MKQKKIAFTIADEASMKYATMMINSLRKFHSEEELPLIVVSGDELKQYLQDPHFFYRATPIIASKLIKDYDLVLKLDADQIITGDLNHVLNDDSYDLGTVLNFNRTDYQTFGPITTYNIDCTKYMNCGFVAMRSERFVEHWNRLCHTDEFFTTLQYREQDIMNILYYYGDYKVKCFDYPDALTDEANWNGLVSYGEWLRIKLDGERLILPKSDDGYPNRDVVIKALHWAHGNVADKMNYRIGFSEDVIRRLDYLVK